MTLGIIAISVFLVLGMGSSYSNIVSASTVEQPQQQQQQQQQINQLQQSNNSFSANTHTKRTTIFPCLPGGQILEENVQTHFNRNTSYPHISDDAFISPFSIVIGNCYIGKFVLAAPTSVCRADEGTPIFIGDLSNIQDGAVLHGLETTDNGKNIDNRRYSTDGNLLLGNDSGFDKGYSVYVGYNTSLAHDSMAHGPAWIGNNTFLGMKSIVFNAKVGNNVAVGISSTITGGVSIPDNKYIPPGSVIANQTQADSLPIRAGSPYEKTNKAVVDVNTHLAEEYQKLGLEKLSQQREKEMEQTMIDIK